MEASIDELTESNQADQDTQPKSQSEANQRRFMKLLFGRRSGLFERKLTDQVADFYLPVDPMCYPGSEKDWLLSRLENLGFYSDQFGLIGRYNSPYYLRSMEVVAWSQVDDNGWRIVQPWFVIDLSQLSLLLSSRTFETVTSQNFAKKLLWVGGVADLVLKLRLDCTSEAEREASALLQAVYYYLACGESSNLSLAKLAGIAMEVRGPYGDGGEYAAYGAGTISLPDGSTLLGRGSEKWVESSKLAINWTRNSTEEVSIVINCPGLWSRFWRVYNERRNN